MADSAVENQSKQQLITEVAVLRQKVAELESTRNRTVETMRANEDRLNLALQIAGLGIWDWDVMTDQTEWYGEMFRMYGISSDQFTGKGTDYINFTRADYREAQGAYIQTAFQRGITEADLRAGKAIRPEPRELCIVRPDGTECYTLGDAIAIIDENGQPLRMLGVTLDITERKQIESSLRESEERYRLLFTNSLDAVLLTSPDGPILDANPAACEMFGSTREELITGGRGGVVDLTDPRAALAIEERSRTGKFKGELTFLRGDGARFPVEVTTQIFTDQFGGQKTSMVIRDITERIQVAQERENQRAHLEELVLQRTAELSEANEKLIILSQTKDDFVSNVSHELRTPIASMMLRHHILRLTPAKLGDHLDVLERETERLRHTIEDLLQLSRLDQEQVDRTLDVLDLNRVVGNYVSDRLIMANARDLRLTFMQQQALPPVLADAGFLEQTLGILLTNAMNYTPSGGSITVKTLTQPAVDHGWVGFVVADTGPGISLDDQKRLFERFFRGETARVSGARGTGLGLAIAREIVDRHQGRIEVESTGIAGEGARFSVWLPEYA